MIGEKKAVNNDIDKVKKRIRFLNKEIQQYKQEHPKDHVYGTALKQLEEDLYKTENLFKEVEKPKDNSKKITTKELVKMHLMRTWLYFPSFRQLFIAMFGPIIGWFFNFNF